MVLRVRSRVRTLVLAVILVLAVTWSLSRWQQLGDGQLQTRIVHNPKGHIKFWQQFKSLLLKHEPNCIPPERLGNAESVRFEEADPGYRPQLLEMAPEDV